MKQRASLHQGSPSLKMLVILYRYFFNSSVIFKFEQVYICDINKHLKALNELNLNAEFQITQIREDFQSNHVEPKIELPKETTKLGAVGVYF
jgi:hypothetical protein